MEKLIVARERKRISIKNAATYFFIYAFLGWILEVIYAIIVEGHFVNRGFLFGPICPIYGYGALLLLFSLKGIKGNKFTKFMVATISFSLFEFIVSYVLEIWFHQRWWDYSEDFLNFQGRISLIYSLVWGMLGIVFTEKLHPMVCKKVEKISLKVKNSTQIIIILSFIIIMLIDTILSIISYL